MGYNDERDQTLNQLLTELDGFEGRPGARLMRRGQDSVLERASACLSRLLAPSILAYWKVLGLL